jgi:2-dehydropantoate 2-reductase
MRIAVIGAGAMGSLACLIFCDAGEEVVVYEQRPQRAAVIKEKGICVRGDISGSAYPEVGRTGEPAAPYDVIVLAVGASESGNALRPLSPFVHRDTVYVSLQDGGAVSILAEMVGEERTFAILARASACEASSGEVDVEEFRSIAWGAYMPGREKILAGLVEGLEKAHAGKSTLSGDLEGEIWRRIEAAAAVSGLCAISGAAPREARKLEGLDGLCGEAALECRRVASSLGREPPSPVSPWEDAIWRDIKPPMLRDIEAGRKTEIDYMSGRIVEQARATGIAAPVHSAILSLVREIESGRHVPGNVALKELKRRVAEETGMSLL